MKRFNFFVVAIAVITVLSSCSRSEETAALGGKPASLRLAINTQAATTRGIDTPGTGSIDIQSMKVLIYNNSGMVLKTQTLNKEQITKATFVGEDIGGSRGYYVNGVDPSASSVRVIAVLAKEQESELEPFDHTVDINEWNGKGKVDFDKLPFEGTGTITKSAGIIDPTGNGLLWTASVTIAPQLARFEVKGEIKLTNTKFFKNVSVTGVYMNNISLKNGGEVIENKGNGDMNWGTGAWENAKETYAGDGSFRNMYNVVPLAAQTDAYQLWAQTESPHVILAVTYEAATIWSWDEASKSWLVDPSSWETRNGYITMRNFEVRNLEDNTNAELAQIEIGKIYKLDFSPLAGKFEDPNVDNGNIPTAPVDPMPEADGVNLSLQVTITKWTEVSLSPKF